MRLTRTGTDPGSLTALDAARAAFSRDHLLPLPSLLEPALLDQLMVHVDAAAFEPRIHEDLPVPTTDEWIPDPAVHARFRFVFDDPALFAIVRDITGCEAIGSFQALIYRVPACAPHVDDWHSDVDGNRLIGLSLNLGRRPFAGGKLQLRRRGSATVLHSGDMPGYGDALLFRIGDGLEHCVTAVTGDTPRLVMTGWFQRQPDYRALLKAPR